MSKELMQFYDEKGNVIYVTAFVGENGNASVQISVNRDYVLLPSKQVRKLARVLTNRVKRKRGYRATD